MNEISSNDQSAILAVPAAHGKFKPLRIWPSLLLLVGVTWSTAGSISSVRLSVGESEYRANWLAHLPSERLPLTFTNRQAAFTYTPKRTGNYLAQWRVGAEVYYRYFSVIDDAYMVLSFATFFGVDPEPTFHGMGIPLDYRLPAERFTSKDAVCRKLLDYNRRFGDLIVPQLPDTPEATHEERVRFYGEGMKKARALLPDPLDHRSIRVDMQHNEDPGYPRTFAEIGVNDHCGLWEANCKPKRAKKDKPKRAYNASDRCCIRILRNRFSAHGLC